MIEGARMSLHGPLAGEPFHPLLRGRRVLVVEDDYIVAEDLREELLRWGAEVMGPVASVADALVLLDTGPAPDMAILDIKLRDELVYPVADALRARGVPFMFVTGFDTGAIPKAYADVPFSEKPVALGEALLAHWS